METFADLKDKKRKEAIQKMKDDGISYEQADAAFIEMMTIRENIAKD